MGSTTAKTVEEYNELMNGEEKSIGIYLANIINTNLERSEHKIWHGGPVWFLEGNPVVGYSKIKAGIRLMFWSGADFEELALIPGSGKFKDASITYTKSSQIKVNEIKRWLEKARDIQWDYKNIVKRKGKLIKL